MPKVIFFHGLKIQLRAPKKQFVCSRTGNGLEAVPEPLAARITEERGVELAVNNVNRNLRPGVAGTVVWPDNERLWSENVQVINNY